MEFIVICAIACCRHSAFPENYPCPQCKDTFVLAWHDANAACRNECAVVDVDRRGELLRYSARLNVFCPQCWSEMPLYGKIPMGLAMEVF